MGVQILHYKQDLKSIVCLAHFILIYIVTLMMILVSHNKRHSYKVSIFYNKRLSSIMPEENKECIKYVQVGNGNKFVSWDDRKNVENYPSKNQVFDEKS